MARPRSRPLLHLFRIIEAKALRDGLSREALCSRFRISASYYGQLSSDPTLLAQASRSVIMAVAEFLGVSFVQAQLWAGQIAWQDFGLPSNPSATVIQYLDKVAMQIQDDEHFRPFAVPLKEWSATPQAMKLRYVALYEYARRLRLHKEAAGSAIGLVLARAAGLQDEAPDTAVPAGRPAARRTRRTGSV